MGAMASRKIIFMLQDSLGQTPLDLAMMLRCSEAVKILTKHGVETCLNDLVEDVLAEALKFAGLESVEIFDPSTGHLNVGVESILLRWTKSIFAVFLVPD
jgi:hypothetical protein